MARLKSARGRDKLRAFSLFAYALDTAPLFLAVYFLVTPLIILGSQKISAQPRLDPIDPAQWPPVVAQLMSRVEHDLYALGFSIVARFGMPNAVPNVSNMVTMLVNYRTGDKAMITAIWANMNGSWILKQHYTEFSTRFEDGRVFDTLNSRSLSSFQTPPNEIKTRVPMLKTGAELFALHRFVMRKHGATGRKIVYDMPDAAPYLLRIWREGFEEQARFGRFRRSGDFYVPTLQGAFSMTWAELFPMKQLRQWQRDTQAKAIVAEWRAAGVQVGESTGNVKVVPEAPVAPQPPLPFVR